MNRGKPPIGDTEVAVVLEIGSSAHPRHVEYNFRHSIIRAEAPDKPVESVPAADIGDTEEVEFVVVRGGLPDRH